MVDIVSAETRSRMMASIRRRNTKPEMVVRQELHAAGFRFRLDVRSLPGSPDIVLPKWRTAIFVHGCFWHRHAGCKYASTPATRPKFWQAKFEANVRRDCSNERALIEMGWKVAIVWECGLAQGVRADTICGLFAFIRHPSPSPTRLFFPETPPRPI
ncbi:very short patch repair endonuclease [Jannaschia sp. CCS1]|uniref:very short patch repair endonuclease n=1 Tax=Jannaschia sp. (strain CCS1) TaxID=290400 RepID=UPI000053D650|nr:very short patch repair endonuclease [Jannaschia sp. CCS1]ABD55774.1 T/G mismatch-specific endonuclease [Jannaschia sp. CCS1]